MGVGDLTHRGILIKGKKLNWSASLGNIFANRF